MRTTKTILVEKEVTTHKCDFCDFTTNDNHGCCGWNPLMICSICDKDICRKHRELYSEDPMDDYPHGVMACPDCNPAVKQNWDWLYYNAGRHDDIVEETIDSVKKGIVYRDD